jgi:Lipopolysaccharide-assembly
MRIPALLAVLSLVVGGCAGYHVGPIKPTPMKSVQRIAVSNFKNDTLEPRIEVMLANAAIKQLHQDGTYKITSEQDADAIVQGTIERIDRTPARSAKTDFFQTSEYTLAVIVKFQAIEKRTGQVLMTRELTGNSSFFVGGRDLRTADVNRDERQAIPQAAEDVAVQLVSALSEGW